MHPHAWHNTRFMSFSVKSSGQKKSESLIKEWATTKWVTNQKVGSRKRDIRAGVRDWRVRHLQLGNSCGHSCVAIYVADYFHQEDCSVIHTNLVHVSGSHNAIWIRAIFTTPLTNQRFGIILESAAVALPVARIRIHVDWHRCGIQRIIQGAMIDDRRLDLWSMCSDLGTAGTQQKQSAIIATQNATSKHNNQ